jgi:hypothetical protein
MVVVATACRCVCCQSRQLQQLRPLLQPCQQLRKHCYSMRSQDVLQEALQMCIRLLLHQQLLMCCMCCFFKCCCIQYAVLEQAYVFGADGCCGWPQ